MHSFTKFIVEPEEYPTPLIIMTREHIEAIKYFVKKAPKECQWFSTVDVFENEVETKTGPQKRIYYKISEIFIPEQEVADKDVQSNNPNDIIQMWEEIRTERNLSDEDFQKLYAKTTVWSHSHVNMPPNPSPTDMSQWKEIKEGAKSTAQPHTQIMMIFNREQKYYSRIWEPRYGLEFEGVQVYIQEPWKFPAIDQAIKTKLKEMKPASITNTGSSPFNNNAKAARWVDTSRMVYCSGYSTKEEKCNSGYSTSSNSYSSYHGGGTLVSKPNLPVTTTHFSSSTQPNSTKVISLLKSSDSSTSSLKWFVGQFQDELKEIIEKSTKFSLTVKDMINTLNLILSEYHLPTSLTQKYFAKLIEIVKLDEAQPHCSFDKMKKSVTKILTESANKDFIISPPRVVYSIACDLAVGMSAKNYQNTIQLLWNKLYSQANIDIKQERILFEHNKVDDIIDSWGDITTTMAAIGVWNDGKTHFEYSKQAPLAARFLIALEAIHHHSQYFVQDILNEEDTVQFYTIVYEALENTEYSALMLKNWSHKL